MSKIILHIDLNAFFVRCEELKNPNLIGKAVIIGHEGRSGIVSTCSYKAREYGIHSGMPTFMATERCKDLIIIPGDYPFYEMMSEKFFEYISRFSKIIEKASIDECYVDMTAFFHKGDDVISKLKAIQDGLYKETGLMCSIGVAPTKFLAKMGSDLKKPMGITIIRRKDIPTLIYPLPIEACFGIGKRSAPELRVNGIKTIGDLAKALNDENDAIIKSHFGKFYYVMKDWLNGYGDDVVDTSEFDPKSIGHSRTLIHNTNDFDEINEMLMKLCDYSIERAKAKDKLAQGVQITLKDASIIKDHFKSITRSKKLDKPTLDETIIKKTATQLLREHLRDRTIRLIGVSLQNLVDKYDVAEQLSIFDDFEELKEKYATKLLISDMNRKYKKEVFKTLGEVYKEQKHGNK